MQMTIIKLAPSDIESYDWDWDAKYSADIEAQLIEAFSAAFVAQAPELLPAEAARQGAEWARVHGAELIRSVSDVTRERVRELVATTLEEGQGVQQLARSIRDDDIFSKRRATTIARTETAKALGQGGKSAAIAQDRDIKRWITQGDALVRASHTANAGQGWIPIADAFQDGQDTIGEPNCRCVVQYGTSVLLASGGALYGKIHDNGSFHCWKCDRHLGPRVPLEAVFCRTCKHMVAPSFNGYTPVLVPTASLPGGA